ncbi:hypothetical protein RIR_jg41432.t1 [Rhizophagus irregularis DAOM 181602=DAOM 197198]|uniref:Uncharacterized protein n=1 Tax=Rhizophagus irregularis (strain DAOM 181602 / DAOM 197198 / MUCL 43194) TaxID=747089 RepID=U9TVE9_RHIID|nr:hypothetical protein RIR_jg41432.t1 [Rhizophagus irregularis DAOM 181602=DAOM 197198]
MALNNRADALAKDHLSSKSLAFNGIHIDSDLRKFISPRHDQLYFQTFFSLSRLTRYAYNATSYSWNLTWKFFSILDRAPPHAFSTDNRGLTEPSLLDCFRHNIPSAGSFFSHFQQNNSLSSYVKTWLQNSIDQSGFWMDKISDFLSSQTVRGLLFGLDYRIYFSG